jgi:hypothetical protein
MERTGQPPTSDDNHDEDQVSLLIPISELNPHDVRVGPTATADTSLDKWQTGPQQQLLSVDSKQNKGSISEARQNRTFSLVVPESQINSEDVNILEKQQASTDHNKPRASGQKLKLKTGGQQRRRRAGAQHDNIQETSFTSAPSLHDEGASGKSDIGRATSLPGAVAVSGFDINRSSSSIVYGDDELQPPPAASAATSLAAEHDMALLPSAPVVVAEVVNEASIRQEIEDQVRHEILQEAVHASMVEPDNDIAISLSGETKDDSDKRRKVICKRVLILVFLGAIIVLGVVLGTVLPNRSGNGTTNNSSAQSGVHLSPSSAPTAAPTKAQCSFCYDGLESVLTDLTLATVSRTKQSCADLSTLSQQNSPEDTACLTSQADAWLYCGCPLLPSRPLNTSCSACLNGRATGRSVLCPKYDDYVAIVGRAATCHQLAESVVFERNCTCSN